MEYHQTLAEDIALLYMIDCVPEPPARNSPPAAFLEVKAENGALTLKQECDIVEAIAFISATSDDPDKVTAVCIEQHLDPIGMTVIMAANTGNLESVKAGLQRIFGILKAISSQSRMRSTVRKERLMWRR
jgi:hypothetical protein